MLSQRFSTRLTVKPIQLYRALRLINPSPYTFFLKFDHNQILVGSSPEVMVRLNNRTAELRPIAGTRPRGKDEQQDHALADELLKDVKERAEHLMLVDLGRNDLGRIATPASVQVKDFMTVERYSHVMHLVSNIEAGIRDDKDAFDLIKATFPAGTLSGAPKIRALEIIHELESDPREIYGGAVGYFGFNGNMDTCITIRTLEIDEDTVSVQAGAGIVYDSDPETEYQETRHKARGMFKAISLAAANLEAARSGATSDLRAYDVHLEWQTATGEAAVFSGTLVITNAPGAPPELSQRNIRGAVLTGDLKIGTQPWRPYSQPYTP